MRSKEVEKSRWGEQDLLAVASRRGRVRRLPAARPVRKGFRCALALLLAGMLFGCSLFKVAEKITHEEETKKPQPPQQAVPPSHEGPLLDNKVTALRVQDALKQAGPDFEEVEVTGGERGVILTGRVKSAAQKARAEEIARKVHRKMKLINELKVGQ